MYVYQKDTTKNTLVPDLLNMGTVILKWEDNTLYVDNQPLITIEPFKRPIWHKLTNYRLINNQMNKGQIIVLFHHVFLMLGLFAYGFNIWYALIIFFASMLWAWQVGSNVMHFGFAHKKYKDTLKNKFFALLTLDRDWERI